VNIQQQSDFYFGSILVSNGFIFYSKWALTDGNKKRRAFRSNYFSSYQAVY